MSEIKYTQYNAHGRAIFKYFAYIPHNFQLSIITLWIDGHFYHGTHYNKTDKNISVILLLRIESRPISM